MAPDKPARGDVPSSKTPNAIVVNSPSNGFVATTRTLMFNEV